MEKESAAQLTALGHPHRLALFRLLMRRYPDRVPAGEIATALGIKASTLSTYLATLMQVGLISQTRVGTSLLYAVNMDQVRATFDYILLECCRGRPEICVHDPIPDPDGARILTNRKYTVLFICTGNSARSIMAETILREIAGDRFIAYSAGTNPSSELNPFAVQVLRDKGHDVRALHAKTIAQFQGVDAPKFDFVFTVCDLAANEECPPWPGQPISGHWGLPDPVKVEGTAAEKGLAFQQTYGAMRRRIEAFAALPLQALDRIALQSAVDDIARS